MNDIINHPPHYCNTEYGCEPIDFYADAPFAEACIIKYIVRYRHKGKPVEDLKKARFYIEWLLKRAEQTASIKTEMEAHYLRFERSNK